MPNTKINQCLDSLFHSTGEKWTSLRGMIIIVEGLIGVGKTTLCKSLVSYLTKLGHDVVMFEEEIPRPLLSLYTTNMEKYAFPFQVIVAQTRNLAFSRACELSRLGKIIIMDRSLLGDCTFALMQKNKGYFTDEEFKVYLGIINSNKSVPICAPYIAYLDCAPETAFERMKKRGNSEEVDGYTLDYFQDLENTYKQVIKHGKGKVVTINWGNKDIVDNKISEDVCVEFLNALLAARQGTKAQ